MASHRNGRAACLGAAVLWLATVPGVGSASAQPPENGAGLDAPGPSPAVLPAPSPAPPAFYPVRWEHEYEDERPLPSAGVPELGDVLADLGNAALRVLHLMRPR